ncbi:MAG: hypothetical protein OQK32_08975 [Gammaproteobacteria bacterium]|nr:hypothetical protein [Gammaproteobacteria bacterium]MCW8922544.1 hypothetical protein [Gammaproteobacteria bacterium]
MKYSLIIFSLLISSSLYASEAAEPAVAATDTEAEAESEALTGEDIFTTYCADACHQAPDRSRLKPKQWRVVLNTMQTRMKSAGRPQLTEDQTKRLLEYLSKDD